MKPINQLTEDEVQSAIDKAVQETALAELTYMSEALEAVITNLAVTTTSTRVLQIIAQGANPMQAAQLGHQLVPVMAFNLGLAAGRELSLSTSFMDMMLGLGGLDDGSAPDAGEPEHG